MRPLDREYDPALTWAGALALRVHLLDRADLEQAWNAPEALQHRAVLKEHLRGVLRQLVDAVQERLSQLPPKDAAA